jgi:hypothetical protein
MGEIVFGAGSSHSPMVTLDAAGWVEWAQRDRAMTELVDAEGKVWTYEERVANAPAGIVDELSLDVFEAKVARIRTAVATLRERIAAARLDALVVVGDDQNEHLFADNLPPFLLYHGATIRNTRLTAQQPTPILQTI